MAIDTSMYGGLLQKPKSIAEYDADRLQVQQAQQQNRLADLVYGEKQREIGGDNALASLLAGGKSGADVSQGLAAAGYGNKALAYTKTLQEQEKQKADIGKTNAEAENQKLKAAQQKVDIAGQAFGFVRSSPTADNAYAAIDHLVRNGVYTEQEAASHKAVIAADPSPAKISQLADMAFRSALSAKDQLAKIETRNLGGTTDTLQIDPVSGKVVVVNSAKNTQSPDSAASVAATIRGQNMTDSRSREANALTREAQANVYDPERGILVNKATGLARPAATIDGSPVAPKDKPLTEFQGKSAAFGDRAMKADKILSDLTGNYSPTAVNVKQGLGNVVGIGGALEAGANMALGANSQKAEQAQRDFINALLRQESGAAISMGEFDNAKKQYFPQPGDSKEVVAQKAANRKTAIDGFVRSAGPSAKLQSPSTQAAPKAGTVMDGYRFKGGNPADKTAWEKI